MASRNRARPYLDDEQLETFVIPTFRKGYNSYAQSKILVEDEEFPYGRNVYLDDNGSVTKWAGKVKYGGEVASGKAICGMAQYRTTSVNELIVAAGTTWKKRSGSTYATLTGGTGFTDSRDTCFVQARGKLYGANGSDALKAYDGTSVSSVPNQVGRVWGQIAYFNARLYAVDPGLPDRLYYSNPYNADGTDGNFGTFDTSLPTKNAGFIQLMPGSGLRISAIRVDKDFLYVFDQNHIWRISPVAEPNADGSIVHTVSLFNASHGTPAWRSVFQVGNDLWFYNYDNYYSLGEVQAFANIRVSTKSGRVRSEINSIAVAGKSRVAGAFFRDRVYIAYQTGSYNDRVVAYDVRLNAWSAPRDGWNVAMFLEFEESDGTRRLLAGSSNPNDSYVYELDSGSDDDAAAIVAEFETKSTDCKKPGLIKRFAFIDVFYSTLFGVLTYEVFIDEQISLTGQVQIGNSANKPSGVGSLPVGTFPVGAEFDPNTTFASLQQNGDFRIDCNFERGKKISVRFKNDRPGEAFKINGIRVNFLSGSIYET